MCSSVGGFFFFNSIVLESSALPLFEVWSDPALTNVTGVEQVTIIDFQNADSKPIQYSSNRQPVVAINCSQPGCTLDGLTIVGASAGVYNPSKLGGYDRPNGTHPAVRVYAGGVQAATISGSHFSGGADVVDNDSKPVGNWAARNSGGGWTMVSDGQVSTYLPLPHSSSLTGLTNHTLMLGKSGETTARLAIDGDGTVHYGPGGDQPFAGSCSFESICKAASNNARPAALKDMQTLEWDPPALPPGGRATLPIVSPGMTSSSICHASHTGISIDHFMVLAATAGDGAARVFLKNEEEMTVDVPAGVLRIACLKTTDHYDL